MNEVFSMTGRTDFNPNNDYLKKCVVDTTGTEDGPDKPLFEMRIINGESYCLAFLEDYAIVPMAEYKRLKGEQ